MYCERSPLLIGFHCLAAIIGAKRPRRRNRNIHALRIAGIENDRVQAHAACARLPLWVRCRDRAGRAVRSSSRRHRSSGKSPHLPRRRKPCSDPSSEGSTCHTRLNSHGCCVPSYHWCVVSGLPVSATCRIRTYCCSLFGGPGAADSPGGVPG